MIIWAMTLAVATTAFAARVTRLVDIPRRNKTNPRITPASVRPERNVPTATAAEYAAAAMAAKTTSRPTADKAMEIPTAIAKLIAASLSASLRDLTSVPMPWKYFGTKLSYVTCANVFAAFASSSRLVSAYFAASPISVMNLAAAGKSEIAPMSRMNAPASRKAMFSSRPKISIS